MKTPKKKFAAFETQRVDLRTGKVLETIEIDIAADLRIGHDIQKALKTSMSTLGWYMQLKEQAHAMMKHAKYKSHKVFERTYDRIRKESPRLSETNIKNRIHLSRAWRKRIVRYMIWRDRYRMLHELCVALKERNDNLRTLESSERREREGAY